MKEFNSYGNLIGKPLDDIKKGDKVCYDEPKADSDTRKTIIETLVGIWDGEKVEFSDKQKTIVRAKEWLYLKK